MTKEDYKRWVLKDRNGENYRKDFDTLPAHIITRDTHDTTCDFLLTGGEIVIYQCSWNKQRESYNHHNVLGMRNEQK
jgi:hypothetical protein